MTVSYSLDVSKARFCGFTKLLARWKGGIYKILWKEFMVFCLFYAILSVTYRSYLNEEQKVNFEKVVIFVETYTDAIPLSFVLGFYVSLVIGRWWGQYETIPWPDRLCFMISSYVHGSDERSRMIRRTLGRYVILAQALTFQAVSTSVKRRFPTTQHLVDAGIMTKEEKCVYDKISFMHGKWWLPCHWFSALATRARKEGRIKDSVLLNGLFQEILNYRNSCAIMFGYDWISVPLVYTQVVTIATYMYSAALIIGRQYLDPGKGYRSHDIDLYIPIFTLLQFFFYMGWLKVAEQILNPYGEDDDDFELNWCLDRAVHIVYLVVDSLQLKHPRVGKDLFWDEMDPVLPQTRQSANFYVQPLLGSANSLHVEEAEYLPLDAFHEQDFEENIYKNDSFKRREETLRPSLIRRLLSSGLRHRSYDRNPLSKQNSAATQGISNPVFEHNNEKNNTSIRKTSSLSPTSSLNNAVKISPSHSRTSSVSFRPNTLSLHRRKTYHLRDAEKAYSGPNSPTDKSSPGIVPVSRTISAPQFMNNEMSSPADEDDCLEANFDEQSVDNVMSSMDNLMPSIPEETSRATSVASIDGGTLKILKSPLKRIEDVHNLVQEANKVLQELHRTVSKEQEVTGYESCCSKSEDCRSSSDEEDEVGLMEKEGCKETSIVIDIDREYEPEPIFKILPPTPDAHGDDVSDLYSMEVGYSSSNSLEKKGLADQGPENSNLLYSSATNSNISPFLNAQEDGPIDTNVFVGESANSNYLEENNIKYPITVNLDSTDTSEANKGDSLLPNVFGDGLVDTNEALVEPTIPNCSGQTIPEDYSSAKIEPHDPLKTNNSDTSTQNIQKSSTPSDLQCS